MEEDWYNSIRESGIEENNFLLMQERRKLDRETTVKDEMKLLEEKGFKDVSCIFQ